MAGMEVKLTDNAVRVIGQMKENVEAALTAMGTEAVGLIVNRMEKGYTKRIWYTGDLQRDVSYEADSDGKSIAVGNSLKYAVYVHEGFAGHPVYFEDIKGFRVVPGGHTAGRPYIRDALEGQYAAAVLTKVAADALKTGFENA